MNSKRKMKAYNVRVYQRSDGTFWFDKTCFMHRLSERKDYSEWVDASARARRHLVKQLGL